MFEYQIPEVCEKHTVLSASTGINLARFGFLFLFPRFLWQSVHPVRVPGKEDVDLSVSRIEHYGTARSSKSEQRFMATVPPDSLLEGRYLVSGGWYFRFFMT